MSPGGFMEDLILRADNVSYAYEDSEGMPFAA